ncbi:hypothetical protein GUJ93_ZPchr0003g18307 [Zizania palustris]|uniref:Uncharacterized protein n=1 Tax=Zizania palustris TaxID=103762 RepID=A0A8J5S3U9_ZIZPA|nr:hypothetical protein GUJ93_ZPchr0003g18307 [Zizania palustris]
MAPSMTALRELSKPPPSGWRHFSRFQARAGLRQGGGGGGRQAAAGVGRGGLMGSWTVPTRPRSGAAGCGAVPGDGGDEAGSWRRFTSAWSWRD